MGGLADQLALHMKRYQYVPSYLVCKSLSISPLSVVLLSSSGLTSHIGHHLFARLRLTSAEHGREQYIVAVVFAMKTCPHSGQTRARQRFLISSYTACCKPQPNFQSISPVIRLPRVYPEASPEDLQSGIHWLTWSHKRANYSHTSELIWCSLAISLALSSNPGAQRDCSHNRRCTSKPCGGGRDSRAEGPMRLQSCAVNLPGPTGPFNANE